jgi:hypothetical protein
MYIPTKARLLRRGTRSQGRTWLARLLSTAIIAAALGLPFMPSDSTADSSVPVQVSGQLTGKRFACGYDPQGATDN